MKAISLAQAVNYFRLTPLSGQDLRFWFVPRAGSPRGYMHVLLKTANEPIKLLFVGHRGSGKSTELNKLAGELSDTFYTINIDIRAITGRTTPEYEDVMLAMSTQVVTYCIEHNLVIAPLLEPARQGWENLRDWWLQVVAGLPIRPSPAETTISAQVKTLLGNIELSARQSSAARDQLKFQINQQMPELIRHLNWVIQEAEANSQKRLLIVVEGLDKVDLEAATQIFRDHAPTITSPVATMIYTCPLALRFSDHYHTLKLSFSEVRYLPNIAPRHRDNSPNDEGIETLRDLVAQRLEDRLIEPAALDLVLQACGGVPVWLVFLVRSAAVYALNRSEQAAVILAEDARSAIKELRREVLAPLSRHDLTVLAARHRDRRLTNDADEQRLIYNGSLIEYDNDIQWCDAHPALWSLLEQADDDNPDDSDLD